MTFLERTREGHRHSDEHWNRFKGNVGETSKRRSRAHEGFSELIDTILNRTEPKNETKYAGKDNCTVSEFLGQLELLASVPSEDF